MDLLALAVCVLIGFFIGCIRWAVIFKPVGSLKIDRSDPDGPYLFLEISKNISEIESKKVVVLNVDTKGFIPRD